MRIPSAAILTDFTRLQPQLDHGLNIPTVLRVHLINLQGG